MIDDRKIRKRHLLLIQHGLKIKKLIEYNELYEIYHPNCSIIEILIRNQKQK